MNKENLTTIREALEEIINRPLHVFGSLTCQKCEEALTALDELEQGQWRDISTAPKGKDPILVYCERFDDVFLAEKINNSWVVYMDGQPLSPTHWQPHPPPPKRKGE